MVRPDPASVDGDTHGRRVPNRTPAPLGGARSA
jgi:hypothetical protein